MDKTTKYNCLECNDSLYKRIFVFKKEVFEKYADKEIISIGNFQDRHIKTLSSGEVEFQNVYVINTLHHLNNLYKLTEGKIAESKAEFVYAEPCENCMTRSFLRHESESKDDKPRKKKRFE